MDEEKRNVNLILLIFAAVGFTVLICYIGKFLCDKSDEHNAKKLKNGNEPKWFYK